MPQPLARLFFAHTYYMIYDDFAGKNSGDVSMISMKALAVLWMFWRSWIPAMGFAASIMLILVMDNSVVVGILSKIYLRVGYAGVFGEPEGAAGYYVGDGVVGPEIAVGAWCFFGQ